MSDKIFHLLYTSTATTPLSFDDLDALLRESRSANKQHGITGVLLYCDGYFMQLLDGEEAAVWKLYENIGADNRNREVTAMTFLESEKRWCGDWSMGFAFPTNRAEMTDCMNLAEGIDPVRHKLSEINPLRETLIGFVERNLRLLGARDDS